MKDTKAPNKAPAYDDLARGAGALDPLCPNCNQHSARSTWPICSWCRLFLVDLDLVDLTPGKAGEVAKDWRR